MESIRIAKLLVMPLRNAVREPKRYPARHFNRPDCSLSKIVLRNQTLAILNESTWNFTIYDTNLIISNLEGKDGLRS